MATPMLGIMWGTALGHPSTCIPLFFSPVFVAVCTTHPHGSIGVLAGKPVIKDLLDEVGVNMEVIAGAPNADAFSLSKGDQLTQMETNQHPHPQGNKKQQQQSQQQQKPNHQKTMCVSLPTW